MPDPAPSPAIPTGTAAATGWDGGRPWALHPSVGLRPEPFGSLAYHYGTRRLTFLKDPVLTDIVRSLGDHPDVPTALDAAGVAPAHRDAYQAALARLAEAEVIHARG